MDAMFPIRTKLDAQLGLITSRQASKCGLSQSSLKRLVTSGRLVRLHRGVYKERGSTRTPGQDALAACLACGDEAWASHLTAGLLLGLVEGKHDRCDVTVAIGRSARVDGVHVHRGRLAGLDRSRTQGVPVTSVPKTLVDLAGILPESQLTKAVDRALQRKSTSAGRLKAFVEDRRFDRFRGIAVLRGIVSDRARFGVPESALEGDMIRLLRDYGLPEPVRQHEVRVRGRVVRFDLSYPDQRLVIELDGFGPHTELDTWQRDHDRHNATELAGWPSLRFTWMDVHERQNYVAITVADGLGLRPCRWKRDSKRSR